MGRRPLPGVFGFLPMLRGFGRLFAVACLLSILPAVTPARAFDYDNYQAADLDALARRKPALGLGVDVLPAQSVRLEVTLVSPATACSIKLVKWAMRTSGIAKQTVASTPITHCIKVKSAKGRTYSIFIQDVLANSLARDVQPGSTLTLYASLVYSAQSGPGLVVNEFSAGQAAAARPADHSGVDLSAAIKRKK